VAAVAGGGFPHPLKSHGRSSPGLSAGRPVPPNPRRWFAIGLQEIKQHPNSSRSFRYLIHRLPLDPRDAAFLAATFLTVDFLAADFLAVDFLRVVVLAVDFLAVDALAGDFLGSVPSDLVFLLSRAGSILAAPAPGANKLSCPSFHRTRYWTRRSPSITSMISPSRAGPPTRRGLTTMRSPFLATHPPSCRGASASSGTGPADY